ncbi:Disease resistance protein RPM1 [Linum perenne]
MTAQQIYYTGKTLMDILVPEAALYMKAHDQVHDMKQQHMIMISFLDDATGPNATTKSKSEKAQIAQVRYLVDDAEDIIDKFTYHIYKWRYNDTYLWYLTTTLAFPKSVWERRRIATDVPQVKDKFKSAIGLERYQLYASSVNRQQEADSRDGAHKFDSEVAFFLNEKDLFGFEAPKQELVQFLTNKDLQQCTTTSLVGMAGSGKTTLAASFFNSHDAKFDCSAWITVSRHFNIAELFRSLIKKINRSTKKEEKIQVTDLSGEMSDPDLGRQIRDYLEGKTYLVVLDDVWTKDAWNKIKVCLPNGQNSSRVILTTRHKDIALLASSQSVVSHIQYVTPLDTKEAQELFCSRAFSSAHSKACPEELQSIRNQFLKKCKGLPIAIDSIGRLLATKECSVNAWTRTLDNLQWELNDNELPLNSVLLLSYNDLPYRLKRCFLYFALFPEDHKIWCDKLVRLWMAEGFLEPDSHGASPEEVGMRYIRELIGRNLLQAVSWDMYGDHGKCQIHDLYRDIALAISKEENFCSVYAVGRQFSSHDNKSNHGHRLRRVSIHEASIESSEGTNPPEASIASSSIGPHMSIPITESNESEVINSPKATNVIKLLEGMQHIRSLLLFAKGKAFSSLSQLGWGDHHLLRVMDMESGPVVELSKDIEVLYNLKYLNMSNTKTKSLPSSIDKLFSLETLDISETTVDTLPIGVFKLENLRHLLAGSLKFGRLLEYHGLKGVKVPSGADITCLNNLQALRLVEANEEIVQQLRKMIRLVQLGITNVGQAHMVHLCSALKEMVHLRWLVVIASTENETLQMDSLDESSSSPLQRLEYLILCGKLESFPNWLCSLPSLATIRLIWSRLPEEMDPVKRLQGMNSLRNVWLHNAYMGSELKFVSGFKSLRALALANLPNLETVTVGEEGVMPDLRIILVRHCPKLKKISQGVKFLSKLKELKLDNVSKELVDQIRGTDSGATANFKHIPHIFCRYKSIVQDKIIWTTLVL